MGKQAKKYERVFYKGKKPKINKHSETLNSFIIKDTN